MSKIFIARDDVSKVKKLSKVLFGDKWEKDLRIDAGFTLTTMRSPKWASKQEEKNWKLFGEKLNIKKEYKKLMKRIK